MDWVKSLRTSHCAASELAEGENRMLQQRVCWLPEPPVRRVGVGGNGFPTDTFSLFTVEILPANFFML